MRSEVTEDSAREPQCGGEDAGRRAPTSSANQRATSLDNSSPNLVAAAPRRASREERGHRRRAVLPQDNGRGGR